MTPIMKAKKDILGRLEAISDHIEIDGTSETYKKTDEYQGSDIEEDAESESVESQLEDESKDIEP